MIPRLTLHWIQPAWLLPCCEEGDLFDRVSLLRGPVVKSAFGAGVAGERVVMGGGYATAVMLGLEGLPPYCWLRWPWGEQGPSEVAYIPQSATPADRPRAITWWHELRAMRKARDDAWLGLGTGGRYHLATGDFDGASVDEIRTALLRGAQGLRRFSGQGLSVLSHMNVTRAIVRARGGRSAAERGALVAGLSEVVCSRRERGAAVHDAHEPLVCDLPTPLKRIMRACGDVWDDIERQAQVSVERLFRVVNLTPEDRAAIAEADRAALVAEAHAFGIGSATTWLKGLSVDQDAAEAVARALAQPHSYAEWEAAWAVSGGDPS